MNFLNLELNPDDWDYLNEGNQHVILKYNIKEFDNDNFFYDKVLRIEKEIDKNIKSNNNEEINEKLEYYVFQNYYKENNSNILKFFPFEEPLEVKNLKPFLESIINKIDKFRPEKRKTKKIDINSKIQIVKNLSLLPNNNKGLIIEIKPKCPFDEEIELEFFDMVFKKYYSSFLDKKQTIIQQLFSKLKATKYEKMQFNKKEIYNEIEKISEYHPKFFFSKEKEKILKSISFLLENPQNNLRIILNNADYNNEKIKEFISDIIYKNNELIDNILYFQNIFQDKDFTQINTENFNINLDENSKNIIKFLLSLTWKDLSIIIRIQESNNSLDLTQNVNFWHDIHLIDTKLKGIEKIIDFKERKQKIDETYLKYLIKQFI